MAADAILLAPGATPRNLPGTFDDRSRNRVLSLRNLADTQRLRALLKNPSPRTLIAGAGLIGTETAGTLLDGGADITMTDPSPLPMQHHVGPTAAKWITGAHVTAGIDFHPGTTVSAVQTAGDNLRVVFDDGSRHRAYAVLTSLGVTPATDWLAESAVPLQAGGRPGAIIVDRHHRVEGLTGIYAAGDAAAVPDPVGGRTRIEHWGAAISQGRSAAATVLNDLGSWASEPSPAAFPSSYSTYVHGTKLTIVGTPSAGAREQIILGEMGAPRFAVSFFDTEDRNHRR